MAVFVSCLLNSLEHIVVSHCSACGLVLHFVCVSALCGCE